ncbi:MAG: Gfo/Idh/MocA family oxidoreductase [Prevotella sp.]|nr:Gfo/Idh/MocA family oxidoreductase [Prevotella sp.]
MIQEIIDRYKRMRTERFLRQTYRYSYAFVGMGQHSLTNLYPVLHYLGVPLKYVCVTSGRKAGLIERKYPGVIATTSLDAILKDDAVRGILVSASPSAHFALASQVLRSGKSLFVEKPPCRTSEELCALIDLQRRHAVPVAMAGLQKRYAPAVRLLRKRLRKEQLITYDLHYLTGAYPEGNPLSDLFIHPLDLVCHLFGQPEVLACQQPSDGTFLLMLRHPHIVGTLELSTSYSWTSPEESLKVCTRSGLYRLTYMEELTFTPSSLTVAGIPMEKLRPRRKTVEYLCQPNNFAPILPNNQLYSHGYFHELAAFVDSVENDHVHPASSLETIKDTYELMEKLTAGGWGL